MSDGIEAHGAFAGRTILVTGGSRGIGRGICERLAAPGVKLAVNYVSDRTAAEETLEMVSAAGAEAAIYRANVSDETETEDLFNAIEADFGPVDMLVANAGIAKVADALSMTPDIWREITRTNIDAAFYPVWRAKDGMMARQYGRIVCISSIIGLMPNPLAAERLIAYGASKAAIIGFVRQCAAAFGPHVRVNGVAPGFIETDMTANASEESQQKLIGLTPLQRLGQVDDVAGLVAFLLSDSAAFITGQTQVVSGGLGMVP